MSFNNTFGSSSGPQLGNINYSQPSSFGSSFGTTPSTFGLVSSSAYGAAQPYKPINASGPQLGNINSPQPSAFGTTPSSFGTTPSTFGTTPSTFGLSSPSAYGATQPYRPINALGMTGYTGNMSEQPFGSSHKYPPTANGFVSMNSYVAPAQQPSVIDSRFATQTGETVPLGIGRTVRYSNQPTQQNVIFQDPNMPARNSASNSYSPPTGGPTVSFGYSTPNNPNVTTQMFNNLARNVVNRKSYNPGTDGRLLPASSFGVSGNSPGQQRGEFGDTSYVTNSNTYNPGTHKKPNYTPYYGQHINFGYPNKYGGKPRKSKKKNRRNRKKTYKNRH